MQVVPRDRILAVDVDGTLIDYLPPDAPKWDHVVMYGHKLFKVKRREFNISLVIHHKEIRGYFILVWSANGNAWAENIVKTLGLENYVDLVLTKPLEYVDDKPVTEWMKNRIFIEEL